jgi:hypothetical protein
MVAPHDPALAQALRLGDTIANAGGNILAEGNYGGDDVTIAKAIIGCTIIDGLVAIIAVLQSYGHAHADTIARSLFEALGDLFAVNLHAGSVKLALQIRVRQCDERIPIQR